MRKPNKWVDRLTSILLENNCRLCNNLLVDSQQGLCMNCMLDLPYTSIRTDIPSLRNFGFIRQHFALMHYISQSHVAAILHELKYGGNPSIVDGLLGMYADELHQYLGRSDVLVPVPLHRAKLNRRGYNQAAYIAEGLSRVLSLPVLHLLQRPMKNKMQARLGRAERWKNSEGIFSYQSQPMSGRRILLIDDVCTTGATLVSAAQTLKQSLPHIEIDVLVLCQAD